MLYVKYSVIPVYEENTKTKTWYVGNNFPISPVEADRVYEIQADGDELLYIIQRFANLPYHTGFVNNWYGDTAKMIASMLCSKSVRIINEIPREKIPAGCFVTLKEGEK